MHRGKGPTARRRTVLKLLAGSVASASLSSVGRFASAADAPAQVGDAMLSLEFDLSLRSRVLARQGDAPPSAHRFRCQRNTPARGWHAHRSLPISRAGKPACGECAWPGDAPCPQGPRCRRDREGDQHSSLRSSPRLCARACLLSQCRHGGGRASGLDQRRACAEAGARRRARLLVFLGRILCRSPGLGAATARRISINATSWG